MSAPLPGGSDGFLTPAKQGGSDLSMGPDGVGWREYISTQGSTQDARWGVDNSQASETIDIKWGDQEQAVRRLLGYPLRLVNGNQSLVRNLPCRHPLFIWLYATSVGPTQGIGTPVNKSDPNDLLKFQGPAGPIAKSDFARLVVTYSTLPYRVLSDAQILSGDFNEWDRWVVKQSKPTVEFATLPGTSCKFSAGPAGIINQAFTGSAGIRLAKTTLLWTWMHVPENYIFNNAGAALLIEGGLGKVNVSTFAGRGPGTLMFDGVDYQPVMAPVSPGFVGLTEFDPPRLWNVIFSFKYFEPPAGVVTNDYASRGHNTAPAGNGFWYPIVSVRGATTAPLYDPYEFANLFGPVPLP